MTQPRTIWQILAELELISHGKTATWNPSGRSRSADRDPCPQGEPHPPHDHYRRAYLEQTTDQGREKVRYDAERELRALKTRQVRGTRAEHPTVRDARIARLAEDGWTWADIATSERSTTSEVKKAASRHHARGGRGESIRDFAARTGLSKSRVHRMFAGRLDQAA